MSSIEIIAFDMGGVLSLYDERIPICELARLSGKSEQCVFNACFSVERKRPLETGRQSWSEFALQTKATLRLEISDAELRRVFDSSHHAPNNELFDLINALDNRYRIGVCSNTGPTHWELQRGRLPYFKKFNPVILSCEVGSMKPSTEIFGELSNRSGVPYQGILFIDDHVQNVEAARALGMEACHFTDAARLRNDLIARGIEV